MDSLSIIDLPVQLQESDCIVHGAMGQRVTARFVDREGGGVCEECFVEGINLEAKLAFLNHQEGAR